MVVSGSGSFLPVLSNHHPITIHSPSIASRQGDRGDRNRSYWRGDNDNDSVSKWLTYVLRHGASEVDWGDALQDLVGESSRRQRPTRARATPHTIKVLYIVVSKYFQVLSFKRSVEHSNILRLVSRCSPVSPPWIVCTMQCSLSTRILTRPSRCGRGQEDVYMDKHGYVSVDQLIALREKEFGKTTSLARRQFQYYRWI